MSCNSDVVNKKTADQPLITVITAVKNNVSTVERTILSVIAQSYGRIEFIVIDGASTDGTVDVVQKYSSSIHHYVSEPDTGVYAAWNKGLELATGEWVCFLGADDYFSDNSSLEMFVTAINASVARNIAVVYGQLNTVDASGSIVDISRKPWEIARQGIFSVMTIPHVATLHKRSLFKEFGKFDERYRIAGDFEFLLRVFERYDALYVPEVTQASMSLGGMSKKAENMRCIWAESKKAKKRHPHNRFKMGRWYVFFLMKLVRFRMCLFVYENMSGSIFELDQRIKRKLFKPVPQSNCK